MSTLAPATQLTLFDDAQPPDGSFECSFSWADEDVSPSALQRLAQILLGTLEVSHWSVKPVVWFRVEQTRIETEKVIATCRVVPSPLGQRIAPIEEDDEE